MFSINKLILLIIIILFVWYLFKIIEKKNKQQKVNQDPKNLEAFQCPTCGLWSSEKFCQDKNCPGSL